MFELNALDIQPSQLFISTTKLEAVTRWLNQADSYDYYPLPVKLLNEQVSHAFAYVGTQMIWTGNDTKFASIGASRMVSQTSLALSTRSLMQVSMRGYGMIDAGECKLN